MMFGINLWTPKGRDTIEFQMIFWVVFFGFKYFFLMFTPKIGEDSETWRLFFKGVWHHQLALKRYCLLNSAMEYLVRR